tara:strand:- start:832 stop:1710 length:879 start_codon:yes stop_codon:yes gene_type:complete
MTWIAEAIEYLGQNLPAVGEFVSKNALPLAVGGSALLSYAGSKGQESAAKEGAQLQYGATQDAAKQQREMFDILNEQQTPYRTAGQGALTNLQTMLPYFTEQQPGYKPFTAADLKSNLAPNYEFMKQQGLGATAQAMNPGGGGSNIDLARTKFAENYAGTAYQDALQNYMSQQQNVFNQGQSERTNIYNKLASLAGIGQTATTQTANLGTGTAANLGQLAIGGATALGAGNIGAANAMAGAYQNIGNSATLASLLNPQGASYSPSQIANANAMNVSSQQGPLSSDFNRYLVG